MRIRISNFILILLTLLINYKFFDLLKKPSLNFEESLKRLPIKDHISFLNFGQKRHLFSWFWIETLIMADIKHYDGPILENWLYLRFKAILKLDPDFIYGYQFAGLYLSVINNDIPGATEIYKLGLKRFPNDFLINLNASVHFLKELQDFQMALKCLQTILYHESFPPTLYALWATLKLRLGEPKPKVINELKLLQTQVSSDEGKKFIMAKINFLEQK